MVKQPFIYTSVSYLPGESLTRTLGIEQSGESYIYTQVLRFGEDYFKKFTGK